MQPFSASSFATPLWSPQQPQLFGGQSITQPASTLLPPQLMLLRAASTQLVFTIVRTAFTAQATSSSSRIAYPRFTEAGFYSADDWLSRLSSETSHLHRQPNYTVEILSTLRGRDQHHPRPATSRIYNYPTYSIEESGTGSTEVLF
jgi:hypothetical protein